ncbi:MAG: hypothetical protein LBU91_03300, partial [Bacteroidales bacterium]|nr:hypothetical protein [Bacteroidales bacterium]
MQNPSNPNLETDFLTSKKLSGLPDGGFLPSKEVAGSSETDILAKKPLAGNSDTYFLGDSSTSLRSARNDVRFPSCRA